MTRTVIQERPGRLWDHRAQTYADTVPTSVDPAPDLWPVDVELPPPGYTGRVVLMACLASSVITACIILAVR